MREIIVYILVGLYGISGVEKFGAYVPKCVGDEDFFFFDVMEYIVRFFASLLLFGYAIFISHNPYTCFLLILEILLIMGRFIYLIRKKKKEYTKLKAKLMEMKANQNNKNLPYQK